MTLGRAASLLETYNPPSVAFCWLAVECAVYLLNRLPTKTVLGYMSPFEFVYGAAPDLKWICIWGCKCYALKPKADLRKGFDEKAYTGYLVRYAQQNIWFLFLHSTRLFCLCMSCSTRLSRTPPLSTSRSWNDSRLRWHQSHGTLRTISSWLGCSTLMTRMALSM